VCKAEAAHTLTHHQALGADAVVVDVVEVTKRKRHVQHACDRVGSGGGKCGERERERERESERERERERESVDESQAAAPSCGSTYTLSYDT
jgi:hypothetical protein